MPQVIETATLGINAHQAWQAIGDFGAVGKWHPRLATVESEGNKPGSLRQVTGKDGSRQVEQLEMFDADRHKYRYSLQSSELPVGDYHAEFRLTEDGPDRSTVTWQAKFEVIKGDRDQVVEAIRQFLKAGMVALAERYAKNA